MKVDEIKFKEYRDRIEDNLKKYPYYQVSIEMPGLGSTSIPNGLLSNNIVADPVGNMVADDEYKRNLVNKVNYVFDRLPENSKRIVECAYFMDGVMSNDEVIEELNINKNKYYDLKKNALYKFGIVFGYF
ncbi:nitroreductase [Clostridium sp. YIM B02555]|uniref:nitroreductase n=1 Tax=Clostridium sp. YIM B02555 TaxID=2911968 RepID=UPI001EECF411|nr:nitroreductase [Clostridium sp. YIM B02555]